MYCPTCKHILHGETTATGIFNRCDQCGRLWSIRLAK